MSGFKEFDRLDGLGLAELVRKNEVNPSDLCEEAIRRIEQVNPKLERARRWFDKHPPGWAK
jgi:amidase